MTDLATRIEQATGPDRELDAEIAVAAKQVPYDFERSAHGPASWRNKYDNRWWDAPEYTASIDAALSLVPEGRILRQYMATRFVPHSCEVAVSWAHGGWVGHSDHSFALALCAAALRASEAKP